MTRRRKKPRLFRQRRPYRYALPRWAMRIHRIRFIVLPPDLCWSDGVQRAIEAGEPPFFEPPFFIGPTHP